MSLQAHQTKKYRNKKVTSGDPYGFPPSFFITGRYISYHENLYGTKIFLCVCNVGFVFVNMVYNDICTEIEFVVLLFKSMFVYSSVVSLFCHCKVLQAEVLDAGVTIFG